MIPVGNGEWISQLGSWGNIGENVMLCDVLSPRTVSGWKASSKIESSAFYLRLLASDFCSGDDHECACFPLYGFRLGFCSLA